MTIHSSKMLSVIFLIYFLIGLIIQVISLQRVQQLSQEFAAQSPGVKGLFSGRVALYIFIWPVILYQMTQ